MGCKNEDAGNQELVLSEDVDVLGNHYMVSLGVLGAQEANKEAQEMMNSLFGTEDYEFQTRYLVRCHSCGETLMDIIADTDTKLTKKLKALGGARSGSRG